MCTHFQHGGWWKIKSLELYVLVVIWDENKSSSFQKYPTDASTPPTDNL